MKSLVLCFLLCATPAFADPAPPPAIILPDSPKPPPPPPPLPGQAVTLTGDMMYVVRSDLPCIVLTSPEGLAKVSYDAGPIKMRSVFVDGNGGKETRTFREKNIWTIEAVGTGRVELLIIPGGTTDASAVVRRLIDCIGPAPPQPGPGPGPPVSDLTKALQAGYDTDSDTTKAKSLSFLAAIYASASVSLVDGATTNADLLAALKAAIHAPGIGIADTAVVGLRKAIAKSLVDALGTDGSALLDKAKAKAALDAIGKALEGVKP